MNKLIILVFTVLLTQLQAQETSICPCEKVWLTLAPDTSVLHTKLPVRRINTSYISWNRFVALGQKVGYPEDDTSEDHSNNFHLHSFGCYNSIVYDKTTRGLFTGELVFTYDDPNEGRKDMVLQRTQIVNGLKDGYELFFGINEEHHCSYPKFIAFFKKGLIYKKVYAFEYIEKHLLKMAMESYNEEGRLYGEVKVYNNGLVYPPSGKSFYNKERIIYEAFILKHPFGDCSDLGQELYGNDNSTEYSVTDENVAFDGRRVSFDPANGSARWEEQWQEGHLQSRKDFYNNPSECPGKTGLLQEHNRYIYLGNGEFRAETIKYFPDCRSSIAEKYSTINHYPLFGPYESFTAPGKCKERGNYNTEGQKDGSWESYTNEGALEKRTTYKAGIENGIEEIFDAKGILFRKLRYENGAVVEIIK